MLKRIKAEDVDVGMFLHKLEGSWLSHSFWKRRFLLETQEQIADLRASEVQWVMIDTARGKDVPSAVVASAAAETATGEIDTSVQIAAPAEIIEAPPRLTTPPSVARHDATRQDNGEGRRAQITGRARRNEANAAAKSQHIASPAPYRRPSPAPPGPRSLAAEAGHASDIIQRSRQMMRDILHQARLGRMVEVTGVEPLVEDIMQSIQRHPHAFNGIVRLMRTSEYLHMHALAVCGLMINLAVQIGLRQEQVREAGLAGLLMDIGMGHVPTDIFEKAGPLSDAEEQIVQSHTMLARDFMALDGAIPESVVDVCLHHHERYDGSGYPHGLVGTEIPLLSRMGAICDIYDAMTARRLFRPGMDPASVIEMMREEIDSIDQDLFAAFVKAIGIYPVGSLVRLSSDRLALVLDQNPKNPTLPRVRVFFSTTHRVQVEQEDVDLVYRIGKDAIVSRENPADWGFDNWDRMSVNLFRRATGITKG